MRLSPRNRAEKTLPDQVLPAAIAMVIVALACSSCGGVSHVTTRTQAAGPRQQATAPSLPVAQSKITRWNIPAHLNADQLQEIDRSKKEFTFDVFGDNRGSTTIFENLVGKVNADKVLFSIDNGDLVDGGSVAHYRMFVGQIAPATSPLLTSVGNHDDGSGELYRTIFGKAYYTFAIGNSYFIVLDDSNERNIDSAQLAWLKERLAESQSYRFRFVFLHVPLFDPSAGSKGTDHSLEDPAFAGMLNDLFDQYQVTLLLTSHIHGYYSGKWGSTPYVITGGAGAPLQGSDPAHFFNHYIRVHVSEQGETFKVVKL